ncbi:MAG TPA: chemotaxis protein CheA [Gemmatimonadaceae bacterium]|nr:chemotaxis protein CheA [Gemmatimonadaceae bacterium]
MSLDPARYAELFRTESHEQLAAINRALLALEQGGEAAGPLAVIFRAVHTVKGMSASMGYTAVAAFAHEVESVLDTIRRGDQRPGADVMDVLFASADALEGGLETATESAGQSPAMAAALERLRALAGSRFAGRLSRGELPPESESEATTPMPAADPLGGPGVIVRVRQSAGALLPGVRAFLVVEKLRALGDVGAVWPPIEVLQTSEVPRSFAMRVSTLASAGEIEAAVRSAGDVEHVEVDLAARTRRESNVALEVAGRVEAAPAGGKVTRHVRMDLARLDTLMDLIGELVITRGRLLALTADYGKGPLDEAMQQAAKLIGDLQSEIMTSRMVPVWQVFDRFPRLVRDASRQLRKDVVFLVDGKDIELDRSLLDEVGEPVVHLLRNAVDHGIETPAERAAAGKPRAGRLVLSAARDRAAIVIRVSDDGRGIDRARVLERAKAAGLVGGSATELDDEDLLRCIAHPGFSTVDAVSDLSGRGVGLDAVQAKARMLGGSVTLKSVEGEGTAFTLRIPATLAIVRALLARCGPERYALPLTHVRETLEFGEHTVQRVRGSEVLVLRDEILPLLYLRDVVRQGGVGDAQREIVVIERGEKRTGLVVDELIGQQDVVVKQFDAARESLPLFSGATILADGAPALIMDLGSLFGGV